MVITSRTKNVSINAPKMCQPIGAIWASLGVHATIPLIHGSQGCSTYPRNLLARHFREPIEVAVTSLHEKATIFGGAANLKEALSNIIIRNHPELITVITTCLSETIGDDIHGAVKNFKAEHPELVLETKIVTINTPSYIGTHINGYDNAIKALVAQLAENKTVPSGKINIIPGMINPGDILEIKHILELMGVEATYLTDISATLNAPLRLPKPRYPKGGTTVQEIAKVSNAAGTLALCKREGKGAASYLQETYGVPAILGELPIGIENTEAFIDNVCKLTDKKIPETLLDERDLLVDAMADANQLIFGTKASIFGDPDVVIALTRFAFELGMQPMHVMTPSEDPTFAQDIQAIAVKYGGDTDNMNIIVGGDLYGLHQKIKEDPVDMLIGDYKGKYISRDEHIPLVRVGFPQADRFGYHRKCMVGYRGSTQLLDTLVNTVMAARDDKVTGM